MTCHGVARQGEDGRPIIIFYKSYKSYKSYASVTPPQYAHRRCHQVTRIPQAATLRPSHQVVRIPQKTAKKNRVVSNAVFLLKKYKLLHGADDQTIAINSTFDGDTEEGVVENITLASAGSRSTGRSATGQNQSHSSDSSNDEKLFHFLFSYYCLF
jgi:hypothetical protein